MNNPYRIKYRRDGKVFTRRIEASSKENCVALLKADHPKAEVIKVTTLSWSTKPKPKTEDDYASHSTHNSNY